MMPVSRPTKGGKPLASGDAEAQRQGDKEDDDAGERVLTKRVHGACSCGERCSTRVVKWPEARS